jgi:hypothetical protein
MHGSKRGFLTLLRLRLRRLLDVLSRGEERHDAALSSPLRCGKMDGREEEMIFDDEIAGQLT